jgi:NADPH:quinone reductase-like Zn-dependent oxidoreductase
MRLFRLKAPGDSMDGYARECVCMPAHAFTKAPPGYTHAEAATLTCAGVTA